MLAAADLTYEAISARMETILRAGIPIPKCWIICIAAKDDNGTPWSYILDRLWSLAKVDPGAHMAAALPEVRGNGSSRLRSGAGANRRSVKVFLHPDGDGRGAVRFDLANGWTVSVANEIGKDHHGLHEIFVTVAWWPSGSDSPEAIQSRSMLAPEQAFDRLIFVTQLDQAD